MIFILASCGLLQKPVVVHVPPEIPEDAIHLGPERIRKVRVSVARDAFSEFPEGTDIDAITAKINDQVAALNRTLVGYKQIKAVEIRTTEFEKTTTRKIKRHLVK